MILLAAVFVPAVAALACAVARRDSVRTVALLGAAAELVLASNALLNAGGATLTFSYPWAPAAGIAFSLVGDGVSASLLALGALVTLLAVLATRVEEVPRPRLFLGLLLLVQSGVAGLVLARDLVQFFVFWELVLVPFLLLIGLFGEGDRRRAAMRLLIFTSLGSLAMLLSILAIHAARGGAPGSFAMEGLGAVHFSPTSNYLGVAAADVVFLGLALAFTIKTPVFPFHGWLAEAYTSAPTPAVMVLSGVVSKLGPYGFYRVAMPLLPESARHLSGVLGLLAVAGIIYGALLALRQTDVKRLLAYLSLSHMSFITLGIVTLTTAGITGGVVQMVNHGILISSLFFIAGHIESRLGTRDRRLIGGLAKPAPVLAAVFFVLALATLGLPGLNGFVGEYLVMLGAFGRSWGLLLGAATGVVLASWYTLRLYQGLMTGPYVGEATPTLEVSARELGVLLPLAVLAVAIGVFPGPLVDALHASVAAVVTALGAY